MLGDVALIPSEYLELHLARALQQPAVEEGAHRLGHAPYVVVLAKKRDEPA